jgi:general secretion pathway protein B
MSFILDALRKSELERQRDSAPGLARSPVATIRRETPVWSWLLIVLLSLALAAVATAWWMRQRDAGVAAPAGQAVTAPSPAEAPEASGAASGAASPAAAMTAATAGPDATAGGADAGAAASSGDPRPISDLIRAYPDLPRYALSFLEFNAADPDSGSAWINGQRYYPGQVIEGGPALVGIRADGALLAYRGQAYLLTTR